jgi:hypothetical protein
MIKTFDDYMKDNKNTNGIQTFDNYVKANNLKISSTIASPNVTTKKKTNWLSKALDVVNFASNPTKGMTNLMTKQAQKGVSDGAKVLNDIRIGNTSVISKPNSNATSLEKAVTTGLNANKLFVENMMKSVEGTIDTGASLLSGTGKVLGANTSKIDNFIKKNLTQNSLDYIFGKGNKEKGRKLQEQADENSYITNKDLAGQVVSAVGGQVPTILASGIAQGSGLSDKNVERVNKLTFGSKVYGNSMEEALNNGASFKDATKYAVGSTAVEIASEWLTGGIPGTNGKGALDNLAGKLIGEPIEKASSSLSKAILKYGYRMVGEASEEMLSEFLQPFVEQLTYKYENSKSLTGNLKEGLNNVSVEDILIAGITGALSAGILDAPVSFSDISQAKRNKANTNINSNLENSTTTEEKIKSNTNTGSVSNIAHTSSNVVQKLNNQEENITERLEKIKRLQEVAKQNKKYDKINEVLEEYKNIQEKQNETMQNIENNQNNLIEQINSETQQPKYDLTIDEQNELDALKKTDLAIGLDEKENARLNYLEKKQNGLIKYPDLIGKNSYENIKSNYWNYKNSLDSYNPTLYNKIKEVTPSYRNTGRMTKNEWLGLSKNIGANFKGDSQSLEKYAVQTWFYASPQNNLNRQGKKFVKFDIGEWLTSFYEGAGVGTEINIPTNANTNAQVNYSMPNLPMSSYNYVESNNTKINELRKSASQYLNSSEKTIRTIDLMEKIIADKDYRIRFNPNITNESGVPVNGLITKENGQVTIELNPNANNYVEFLIVHEITHDIATNEMKELILDYAKQDSKFEKSLETLKERYKTDDVSDEVVADVCGELFGNREFIQSVVEKKPNIFMKILNNIRELAKKIKGSKAEGYVSFVEKLKTMWEDAYYSNESKLNETKYSTIGLKGAKNLSKNNNTREYKKLFNRQKQAEDIHNNSTDTLDNTNIKSKRETGWYKTKYGDWGTLITDKDAKLIKTLEPNKTYRLEEILKHDLLYQAYPELKKIKVTTESFNKNALKAYGYYSPFFLDKGIYLNNYWINKGVNYKGTLLHEINHYIEGYEKYNKKSRGANLIEKDRKNNLGEIISDEAKIYSEFTQEELNDIIDLEQMKENPNYKNYSQRLIQRNNLDFKKINEDVISKDDNNSLVPKNNTENIIYTKKKNGEERQNNRLKLYDEELDNSSFSLEQRISGDELLDAQDLIEEIKSVGAKVDKNGYVTLYHQTTAENADKIKQSGKMFAKEPYVYFSTSENASQAEGRGYTKLEFKIPAEKLILDDIFDDNADVKVKLNGNKELDVSNYIANNTKYSQSTDEWNNYLKENFPSSGTKTKMSDIKLPVREDINKQNNKNNLSTKENSIKNTEELATILKEKPKTIEEKDNWLKKLATIKFIDKGYYIDKLARQTKNKELSSKYDYSLLANGIANQIIGNGRVDEKGSKVGKGLYEIFEPIENSGLLDEFSNYIYHKHNVDRMSLTSKFQEDNKAVFGDSMTSEMSDKIVKDLEKKYPEFQSWAKDIYEYNQANLKMLVKYDVISEDSMKYYNKKYPHYVPTIRHNDKPKIQMDMLLGKNTKVNSPIKKAKGGNGDIIPLKDAMALRTMQTVNSALKNNFGLELLNTIATDVSTSTESVDTIVDEINVDELLQKSDKKKPASMSVFLNGEKITFDISDEIYEALKPSNIYTSKVLNKLNNIRRGLLTEYNPTFMITNPLKDIQDGSINSKHPAKFAKNLVEATKQIKNKGMYYQLYMANGGSYETYFNYNTGTNIAPSKIDKIAPLKKISEANELIEMTPRLAEFISSIESGDSIETAMYNASEITTNFKRGGDITKTLDRNGATFLNAGVQGAVKQIRNIQEARTEGIKGISKLAVRWTIAGLGPALLMGMIWDDDEDYEDLSDYIKNNYYILGKYDNGKFIRIPKGRVVSVLQNFFQNIINGATGKEIDLDGFIDLLNNNVLPSDPNESSLIAPLKQAVKNETWYGGELVPTRLQNLPNAEQYDESTDSISIWLGKKLGISPYKINYVLDQYAGAIGDYTLPFLTQQAESGTDSASGKLLAPIKDKFTADSVFKNQNISDIYSLSDELTKKSNSATATNEDIIKNKYINSIKSEMSDLYAEKRKIQNSSQKDSVKFNKSREIQNQINELAKIGLNNYENVDLSDDYAVVGDKEYYLNKNEEWTKVDKTSTKYKTASLLSGYKNYLKYNNEVNNIKNTYKNVSSRKNAIIKYINGLNLSVPQKAILIKTNYSSFDNYNSQVINYVNTSNNSMEDKKEILKSLGFEVYTKNGKTYVK